MTDTLDIEFVSDIACPWCLIGLRNLESALEDLEGEVAADIRFAPFELNPDMPAMGMDRATYFREKYRLPEAEARERGQQIVAAAAETGFAMNTGEGFRLRNTFDAHRLLEWAQNKGKQRALKHALFAAYFTEGKDIGDRDVLSSLAESVGLDGDEARQVLDGDAYADEVRRAEAQHRARGIMAVPTIIVAGRYQINGSHPPDTFAKALRHIAGELQPAA